MSERLFAKEEIISLFHALGKLAFDRGETIEIGVVGGSAISLIFACRKATEDIDAFALNLSQNELIHELALLVAIDYDLPERWLNDSAKSYLTRFEKGPLLIESEGIRVFAPALDQLLAMKLSAWRNEVDKEDARRILEILPKDKEARWNRIKSFILPGRELKAEYAFEELWSLINPKH
ncbi:MAG: hypothetical protein KIT34_00930 [Cyanobacteria bacterium TGS_CYA1]|nr:hypothetical protein [Cyanobacteria bacterium TGS_CYA1]